MIEQLLAGFQAMSYWEYIAVFFGLAYVLLAIKQSLWCWPAAFVNTFIYTLLFWQGFLYMESFLNFYYLLMALYGWWQWRGARGLNISQGEDGEKQIVSWSMQTHLKWIGIATLIALVLGFVMNNYTQAKMAYLDTFTTVFAVMATYLVTQKVLENWLYWVVIDIASIYIYLQMGYLPTACLFGLYTLLAVKGYYSWKQEFKDNNLVTATT